MTIRNIDSLTNADYVRQMGAGHVRYPGTGIHWYTQLVTLADFTPAAALTQDLDLNALFPDKPFPPKAVVQPGSFLRLVEVFAGGTISAFTAILGHDAETPHAANDDGFVPSQNIFTGASLGVKQSATQASAGLYFAALDPILQLDSATGDIDEATTGKVEVNIPFTWGPGHF